MKPVITLFLSSLFLFHSFNASAANRFWVSAVASNWNNTANWSNVSGGAGGFSVPGLGDAVIFNNARVGNCTLDMPGTVLSFTVNAGYTGTIFQGANIVSTVNNASFAAGTFVAGSGNIIIGGSSTFTGGLFTGSTGNISITGNASFTGGTFTGGTGNITIGGNFTLNGTIFTTSSGMLEFDGNVAFTSATFTHNNGSVRFSATGGTTTISGTSPAFYLLEFVGNGFSYNITSAGNITVANDLNFTGGSLYNLNTGTIDLSGNINVTNTAAGCTGTGLININGTGNQNFNGSSAAGLGALPKMTINKTSGALNLSNFPSISNTFTYTTGTVNAGTSTVSFTNGSTNPYTINGSLTLNNIEFLAMANQTITIGLATVLTTNGDLTMAGTGRITLNTGTLNVNGSIFLNNTAAAGGGTAIINIIGAGNQSMDGTSISVSQNLLPLININKGGGTLTLKGNISASRTWTYTAGTVDAASFTSTVAFGGNALNVTSAGMSFYNVIVTASTITLTNNLTIAHDLAINAGRLAPGASTVNLSGNWTDYGTAGYTEATSVVNLNGSGVQTITSPGGENFASVAINNSGSGIQLINDLTIATTFTMMQGNINLNGNNLTLGISIANNGTLNRTSGTILGTGSFIRWFKTGVIPNGSVNGLFPMGTSADFRPFYVSAPAAGPTTGGTIQVAYNDATTNTSIPTYLDGASTIQVRKDLNWAIVTGNGLNGGTFNLDVQGTGYGLIGAVSDLRLTLANSVVGLPGVNAGTTANPQIARSGLTLANLTNNFYIGSINSTNTPLPISLIFFKAAVKNDAVVLTWTTAAEINSSYFTIQRSTDVIGWENIQNINGAGTTGTTKFYTAKDMSPYWGVSYYRLMQTDFDGKSTYSYAVSVNIINKISEILVYPNPAVDHLWIRFESPATYEVAVFNNSGQLVNQPVSVSGNKMELNIAELTTGIYVLCISHDGKHETRKIVIRK
jgi:Secretion system C-terminal sorting domain